MFKERPYELKLFDALNPEYELANSYVDEINEIGSPLILYFSMNDPETKSSMDNVDLIYGETKQRIKYFPPKRINAIPEINPVLEELTSLGLSQIEEINFSVGIPYILSTLGQEPKGGDILRISYVEQGKPLRDVFYTVVNVLPSNLFNFQYLNYTIHAEQTRMADVPTEVKNYLNLE